MPEFAIGKEAIIQTNDEASSMPLWTGITIIVVSVVFLVVKRKK